jgi:hypothetical protein
MLVPFLERKTCVDVCALIIAFLPVTDFYGSRTRSLAKRIFREIDVNKYERSYWQHRLLRQGGFRTLNVQQLNDALVRTDSVLLFEHFQRVYREDFHVSIEWLPLFNSACVRVLKHIFTVGTVTRMYGEFHWRIENKTFTRRLNMHAAVSSALRSGSIQLVEWMSSTNVIPVDQYLVYADILRQAASSIPMLRYVLHRFEIHVSAILVEAVYTQNRAHKQLQPTLLMLINRLDRDQLCNVLIKWGFRHDQFTRRPYGMPRRVFQVVSEHARERFREETYTPINCLSRA